MHKRYHKLTDADGDKILLLAEQGVKRRYIAERFDITSTTVRNIINKSKRKE